MQNDWRTYVRGGRKEQSDGRKSDLTCNNCNIDGFYWIRGEADWRGHWRWRWPAAGPGRAAGPGPGPVCGRCALGQVNEIAGRARRRAIAPPLMQMENRRVFKLIAIAYDRRMCAWWRERPRNERNNWQFWWLSDGEGCCRVRWKHVRDAKTQQRHCMSLYALKRMRTLAVWMWCTVYKKACIDSMTL